MGSSELNALPVILRWPRGFPPRNSAKKTSDPRESDCCHWICFLQNWNTAAIAGAVMKQFPKLVFSISQLSQGESSCGLPGSAFTLQITLLQSWKVQLQWVLANLMRFLWYFADKRGFLLATLPKRPQTSESVWLLSLNLLSAKVEFSCYSWCSHETISKTCQTLVPKPYGILYMPYSLSAYSKTSIRGHLRNTATSSIWGHQCSATFDIPCIDVCTFKINRTVNSGPNGVFIIEVSLYVLTTYYSICFWTLDKGYWLPTLIPSNLNVKYQFLKRISTVVGIPKKTFLAMVLIASCSEENWLLYCKWVWFTYSVFPWEAVQGLL